MARIGYSHLCENLNLVTRPLARPSFVSFSVNRRVDSEDKILFPSGVAVEDSPLGHIEFALRHEDMNLEVLTAALERIGPNELVARYQQYPNGEYVRRACFFWEWNSGKSLDPGITTHAKYIELFRSDTYAVAPHPLKHAGYRVFDNALGNRDFCPIVTTQAMDSGKPSVSELLERARARVEANQSGGIYDRAMRYLYLSETRSNFAIENEVPSAQKEERFVQLLQRATERISMGEPWLVELQNAAVRDAYSQEASYRSTQNWLEDNAGRITFLPPDPHDLRKLMTGWESFTNDTRRGIDPLIKAVITRSSSVTM